MNEELLQGINAAYKHFLQATGAIGLSYRNLNSPLNTSYGVDIRPKDIDVYTNKLTPDNNKGSYSFGVNWGNVSNNNMNKTYNSLSKGMFNTFVNRTYYTGVGAYNHIFSASSGSTLNEAYMEETNQLFSSERDDYNRRLNQYRNTLTNNLGVF